MKIDLSNYEAFFLDYIEGRLNKHKALELEEFLSSNPDLRDELSLSEQISLNAEPIFFPNKQTLKKFEFEESKITQNNFEDFCIARNEGLLSTSKEKELLNFITTHPNLEKDFTLFEKIQLRADSSISFPLKKNLYRNIAKERNLYPLYKWVSIAASIVLIIALHFRFNRNELIPVQIEPKKEQKITASQNFEKEDHSQPVKTITKLILNQNNKIKSSNVVINTISNVENEANIDSVYLEKITPKPVELIASLVQEPEMQSLNNRVLKTDIQGVKTQSLTAYALSQIEKNLWEDKEEEITKSKLSFFKILQTGVKGINQLTGTNMQLTGETNEEGKLTAMSFQTQSGIIQFHQKRRK